MKQYLKPCAYKQSERPLGRDGVPFVEGASELRGVARLSHEASRSESESEQGVQSRAVDAKPGELAMGRLKRG